MSDGLALYGKVKLSYFGSKDNAHRVVSEAYPASMEHGRCMFVWDGSSKDEVMGTMVYMDDDFFVFGDNEETMVFYKNNHGGIIHFRKEGSASEYMSCGVQGKTLDAAVESEKRDFLRYRGIIDGNAAWQPGEVGKSFLESFGVFK
jgi:hypothetical protein